MGDELAAQDLEFVVANKVTRIINCSGRQVGGVRGGSIEAECGSWGVVDLFGLWERRDWLVFGLGGGLCDVFA